MPRGRIIFGFLASIAILETDEIANADGYDQIFREPIKRPDLTDPTSPDTTDSRIYGDPISIRCQIEPDSVFDTIDPFFPAGRSGGTSVTLCFHFKDLESNGLVDLSNGEAVIRLNHVLQSISDLRGNTVRTYRSPGFYATEVSDAGIGLGGHRNLLLVRFEERKKAAT